MNKFHIDVNTCYIAVRGVCRKLLLSIAAVKNCGVSIHYCVKYFRSCGSLNTRKP
jgi:hypothetical protein